MPADSLRIGRIFGIDINLHWTFLLLMFFFLLISFKIFLLFVLLFICVLIHELSHSYTAIKNKIKVKEIVLLPIGGISVIDDMGISPRTEFNVAIAGPLMSFLLGGLFGIAVVFTPPGDITFFLQSLFILNIALGVLNILPAFPLDGGRVFKSYLERKYNQFKATSITVRLSKYIAALFVIIPAIYLYFLNASFDYKAFEFFIYLIVAYFLYGGSQAEMQNMMLKKETAGLKIDNAISKNFLFVSPSLSLKELYKLMEKHTVSIILTRKQGKIMLVDLFRRQMGGSTAGDIAVEIPEVKQGMQILDALKKIESRGKGIAVVLRGKKPVGVVTGQHLNALISLHMLSKKPEPS